MAISFPQNPTAGDTYVVGQNTFVFDGALWTLGATRGATFNVQLNTNITNTAPSDPNPGDIWLNATTGQGLVYFDDGDTQQWVDIGQPGPPGGPGYTGSAGTTGFTGSQGQGANVYDNDTDATGFFDLPVGTTAQRPGSPTDGYTRVNSTNTALETYYDGNWVNVAYFGFIVATGGNVSTFGNFKIHTFETSGSFVVSDVAPGATIEYLVVGGGGAGGGSTGGGGGAGGVIYQPSSTITTGTFPVIVGGGAPSIGQQSKGVNGDDTEFYGVTAFGGGAGAFSSSSSGAAANNGGSGGGGTLYGGRGGGPGAGVTNQGNSGGLAFQTNANSAGGGGGGAGAPGDDATVSASGAGGIGVEIAITGTPTYYGGGGGAGQSSTGNPLGGLGGGGQGGSQGASGVANTGGGGGGGFDYSGGSGGGGGSGVVIIRYRYQ